MKIIKLLFIGFLLLLSVGYMIEIFDLSVEIAKFPLSMKLFGYGGLTFLIFWLLFKKRFMYAFSVFEHECTHILIAKLFFLNVFSENPAF
jgi:hypothetical protein